MISCERVFEMFSDCLFRDDEVVDGKVNDESQLVEAEGIAGRYGFHKDRLNSHRDEVIEMLAQLPDDFRKSKGGGFLFLKMCQDRDGAQWDGHQNMEQLLCMGIGLDVAGYCAPRAMWAAFPGGMPYVWINIKEETPKHEV